MHDVITLIITWYKTGYFLHNIYIYIYSSNLHWFIHVCVCIYIYIYAPPIIYLPYPPQNKRTKTTPHSTIYVLKPSKLLLSTNFTESFLQSSCQICNWAPIIVSKSPWLNCSGSNGSLVLNNTKSLKYVLCVKDSTSTQSVRLKEREKAERNGYMH